MDFISRQRRLQSDLGTHDLDVLLVTHPANICYLCGFTGSAGALVLSEDKGMFFTDGRYSAQSHSEVKGTRMSITREPPLMATARWLASRRGGLGKKARIGIEGEYMTVASRTRVRAALGRGFQLVQAPNLVERARIIKDDDEIELIRAAANLGEKLWRHLRRYIRPGIKEAEVAAEMEYAARRAGAQEMSFRTIIAGGKRSALPHGIASEAGIPARGFVVCDFGVILSGYCSDMTRTVYMGHPTRECRRVYEAVRQAQEAAVEAVKPGVSVVDVDLAARKSLKKQGLAKFFTHSTGHGVGLEIHESPRIAALGKEILRPGMVITIEPGAYIPGKWGVRLEDMVLVTKNGSEVLTPSSKELLML
ncbi:MAG: aminopeptidase PapA [Terriglobales bacterium]